MFESLILMTPLAMSDDVVQAKTARTVLIVDDEILIRWSIGERLKQSGYGVIEAANGADAMAALKAGGVHAVLLDIKLPDANGLRLLSRIKALAPAAPVLMITAHGTEEMAADAAAHGAYAFVHKPFDVEEIAALVDKALTSG